MKQQLIAANGSVQNILDPTRYQRPLQTVWELKQKELIDMAADRGAFIDQSQSSNVHIQNPNLQVNSMHFYAWKKGLKTAYYLRTKAATDAIKFTVDAAAKQPQITAKDIEQQQADMLVH